MSRVKLTAGASAMPELKAGFAKLQGEDFEYYMRTYSIMLGRNSTTTRVDVDLTSLGGGKNISRHHARIFYDFHRQTFALDVIGRNGCLVEGVMHLPGNPPVKLDSQDLLQIGDKKFYFLLPTQSIFASLAAAPIIPSQIPLSSYVRPGPSRLSNVHDRSFEGDYGREDDDTRNGVDESETRGKQIKRTKKSSGELDIYDNRSEIRSTGDRDMDNQNKLQMEEKDVVSSVATVLSDLCGPGEWTPMAKLHTELLDHFGNVWHHSRVRKYLTAEDWSPVEAKGRPWYGLLALLRKYPEHFVIDTRSEGRAMSEFISLVSLLS